MTSPALRPHRRSRSLGQWGVGIGVGLSIVLGPYAASAPSLSLHRGHLVNGDGDETEAFPTAALRADAALAPGLLVEAGLQYAPVVLTRYVAAGHVCYRAPRYTADIQLQLQPWWRGPRPYPGLGLGAFTYRQLPPIDGGRRARLQGRGRLVTAGVRWPVGQRLGLRGELRLREDTPSFGYLAVDGEWALGVSYRW